MNRQTSRRKKHFFVADGTLEFTMHGEKKSEPAQFKVAASKVNRYCMKVKKLPQDVMPGLMKDYFIGHVLHDEGSMVLKGFVGVFI